VTASEPKGCCSAVTPRPRLARGDQRPAKAPARPAGTVVPAAAPVA